MTIFEQPQTPKGSCPKCGSRSYGYIRVQNLSSKNQLKKGCVSCRHGIGFTDRLL